MVQRQKRGQKPFLWDSLRQYLETGNYLTRETFPHCPGRAETFKLAYPSKRMREQLRRVWLLHREAIMADWREKGKVGVPWAAKIFGTKGGRKND